MVIVINGNAIDGFTFHGPFKSDDEACTWGDNNFDESGYHIAPLEFTDEE
jgi:hypothetical protein